MNECFVSYKWSTKACVLKWLIVIVLCDLGVSQIVLKTYTRFFINHYNTYNNEKRIIYPDGKFVCQFVNIKHDWNFGHDSAMRTTPFVNQ